MEKSISNRGRKEELSETMEDYIEVIKILEREHRSVRVKHIAEKMRVKMPSVTSALTVLKNKDLVKYEKYDYIELTEKGEKVANSLLKRHEAIKRFLMDVLNVDIRVAEKDACGMEHHVSKQTVDHILKFLEYIEYCPHSENMCMRYFRDYLATGKKPPCSHEE